MSVSRIIGLTLVSIFGAPIKLTYDKVIEISSNFVEIFTAFVLINETCEESFVSQ